MRISFAGHHCLRLKDPGTDIRCRTMGRVTAADHRNARLVQECLEQNQEAWRTLVDRFGKLVASVPRRMGVPPEDTADIFQAVFLELFQELPRLRQPEALQAWLIRVATNKCYRWQRTRDQVPTGSQGDWNLHVEESAPLLPDRLAQLESEQMVREAIAELTPRCRELVELLFFEQPPMSYAEAAKRLGLAPGSIGFIRGRCLERLRRSLETKGF